MKPTDTKNAIVKAAWLLNNRGQNFVHAVVGDEFRMYQPDNGHLSRGGITFPGKGLVILFSQSTQRASVYAYSDEEGGYLDPASKPPEPCWAAFEVDLAGLGHIAMANRLGAVLTEMHGINETSGMESVSRK